MTPMDLDRRTVLRAALAAAGTATLAACSTGRPAPERPDRTDETSTTVDDDSAPRTLLIFFSRAGENYHRGGRIDLETGNTAVLAQMIADRSGCDVHEVLAADPYPRGYDATVDRNTREQQADARPAVDGDLPDLSGYDVVLLASPIWNVRPPMIMQTVAEALDLSGRTVHPVVTYAVSGLGDAADVYARSCAGATIGRGLAVQGEDVARAGPDVDTWLAATDLAAP
ncbi:flavodoxin [Solicola sp. PLA-1-18]|uniref:flavodoxin n=1 Tax=Solicola sp. PLA-1-18 TaxID=3380532 RepID=UPI003B7B2DB3